VSRRRIPLVRPILVPRRIQLPPTVGWLIAGVLVALVVNALGGGRLDPVADPQLLRRVCELALVVAVFGSGLAVERRVSRSSRRLIAILIVAVMPACIALVAVFGATAMGLSLGAAVLLGGMLAPTDPVLAGDVGLSAPGEPEVGEPRLSLHTEAGANDGLASPFVVVGLLIASHRGDGWIGHWLAFDLLYRAGVAGVIGVVLGAGCATALGAAGRRAHLDSAVSLGLASLAVAFAIYGLCELVDGYGLVAVFVAGIAFRRREPDDDLHAAVHYGTERAGGLLEAVVLGLVGATLSTAGLAVPGVAGWLLAPLLIVVVRPALVLWACAGSPLDRPARAYLGWFGVRGVAAVYYAVGVAADHALPPHATAVVVWTTLACVVVSIVAHGLSAPALMRRWL
jgi:NhaP-type Na+/H+ or K+/H+ antiporter